MNLQIRHTIISGLALLLFLAIPVASFASVLRTGDEVNFNTDQTVDGDFYVAGSEIVTSGEVTGDSILIGGQITHNGSIGEDLLSLGGVINQNGIVVDDARLVGGEVFVDGEVGGDLVVVGGTLTVLSTAKITGDLIIFGGTASINGEVGNNILGVTESIRIDGKVGGKVDVTVSELTLGDRAEIQDAVIYRSNNELIRAQNAFVGGDLVRNEMPAQSGVSTRMQFVPLLIILFAALSLYLLMPKPMQSVVQSSNMKPFIKTLIGFGVIILTPMIIVLLLVSVLGSLLGIALLMSYGLIVLTGIIFGGAVAGHLLYGLMSKQPTFSALIVALGTVFFYLLLFLPFVGPLLFVGFLALSIGSQVERIYLAVRG
jgi:hypothetical protein